MIIFQILMMLDVFAIMIGLPTAIFFVIRAINEKDIVLKKNFKKKAWKSFLGPIIFMLILVILWGVFQTVINMNQL